MPQPQEPRVPADPQLPPCSLPSPCHGPAERPGEPAHGQPAGGHLGPAAAREPERERPRLQGKAPSHGLAVSSRSPERQDEGPKAPGGGQAPPRCRSQLTWSPGSLHRRPAELWAMLSGCSGLSPASPLGLGEGAWFTVLAALRPGPFPPGLTREPSSSRTHSGSLQCLC